MEHFWKILSDVRSLMIAGGVALFSIGVVGEVTGYIPKIADAARVAAMIAGVVLAGVGIYLVVRDVKPKNRYGISIVSPHDGARVQESTDVRGKIERPVPKDKELWILRIYPQHQMFVPIKQVESRPHNMWLAKNCYIGGNSGDHRFIGAYICEPSAIILFKFFFDASHVHEGIMKQLNVPHDMPGRWLPAIQGDPAKMENMTCVEEILVER